MGGDGGEKSQSQAIIARNKSRNDKLRESGVLEQERLSIAKQKHIVTREEGRENIKKSIGKGVPIKAHGIDINVTITSKDAKHVEIMLRTAKNIGVSDSVNMGSIISSSSKAGWQFNTKSEEVIRKQKKNGGRNYKVYVYREYVNPKNNKSVYLSIGINSIKNGKADGWLHSISDNMRIDVRHDDLSKIKI